MRHDDEVPSEGAVVQGEAWPEWDMNGEAWWRFAEDYTGGLEEDEYAREGVLLVAAKGKKVPSGAYRLWQEIVDNRPEGSTGIVVYGVNDIKYVYYGGNKATLDYFPFEEDTSEEGSSEETKVVEQHEDTLEERIASMELLYDAINSEQGILYRQVEDLIKQNARLTRMVEFLMEE